MGWIIALAIVVLLGSKRSPAPMAPVAPAPAPPPPAPNGSAAALAARVASDTAAGAAAAGSAYTTEATPPPIAPYTVPFGPVAQSMGLAGVADRTDSSVGTQRWIIDAAAADVYGETTTVTAPATGIVDVTFSDGKKQQYGTGSPSNDTSPTLWIPIGPLS